MNQQFSLDVGSAQTKVMSEGKVIWQEPTCLSLDNQGQGLSIGQAASVLLGKTPPEMKVVFPVTKAALVDEGWFDQYLQLLRQKILSSKSRKLSVDWCQWWVHLPEILSPASAQVWKKSCQKSLSRVKLISTSQIVANLSDQKQLPSQALVIMIGHQSTGLFVLYQKTVTEKFFWTWGMEALLEPIEKVLKDAFQIIVSQITLRQILTQVASVQPSSYFDKSLVVQAKSGRYQTSVAQIVTSNKFKESLLMELEDWLLWLQHCLTQISEETHKQLLSHGVWLIGGGAKLPGLSALISEKLQCPVQVLAEPELAVVRGLTPTLSP